MMLSVLTALLSVSPQQQQAPRYDVVIARRVERRAR